MENYPYTSYADSGDSSPRSREIEFENPPPWDDQSTAAANNNNYKVRFMCSYGGKIHPRPHDHQLSYIGGDTKILTVDRTIQFAALSAKLISLCDAVDVCFKYQLPGEDLDALISVTNDDDLEHMMHEYDRFYRASPKPARLRLFLFPVTAPSLTPSQSFCSSEGKSERERFVEALNSAPAPPPSTVAPPGNADFLFMEKATPPPLPLCVVPAAHELDATVNGEIQADQIQKHIQDLTKLQIGEEQQSMSRKDSEDNLVGGFTGDYYVQKMPEKVSTPASPPTGYWPENHSAGGVYPSSTITSDQPVYMIPAPASMYHVPMGRAVTGPVNQGYYTFQRMPAEVYREQPVYSVLPPAQTGAGQSTKLPPQLPPKGAAYPEGIRMVTSTANGGGAATDSGYTQVAYDSALRRHVYYTAQGPVVGPAQPPQQTQYQGGGPTATTFGADMRPTATFNQEGGMVIPAKIPQAFV